MSEDLHYKVWELMSPCIWKKHNLTIVADGVTEDGTRIHLVLEDIEPVVIDNAIVNCVSTSKFKINQNSTHWWDEE